MTTLPVQENVETIVSEVFGFDPDAYTPATEITTLFKQSKTAPTKVQSERFTQRLQEEYPDRDIMALAESVTTIGGIISFLEEAA